MKLLILGGTRFLGRHTAEQALAAGHQVTLLHRGKSGAGLFPAAEHIVADRNGDLSALAGGTWDAVIDTSAYFPRQVRHIAQALAGRVGPRVGHYQLVSTISVYAGFDQPGIDETGAVQQIEDPTTETVTGATYGGLKALCEQAAFKAFGEQHCLVNRPGLIVGPFDPTERFTWWARRAQRGGEVLAPGDADAPVQCIDARDAAAWMLLQATRGTAGVFNLTGPSVPTTMGEFLQTAVEALAPAGTRLHWVDEAFLLEQGVAPWSELPLWLPRKDGGLHTVQIARALATGLQCRPLRQTLLDTAAWAPELAPQPAGAPPRPGLAPERETALLAAWQARSAA
jgi:2'-hydroxyisoflavone reductase